MSRVAINTNLLYEVMGMLQDYLLSIEQAIDPPNVENEVMRVKEVLSLLRELV